MSLMNITSAELWDELYVKLVDLKDKKGVDPVLKDKIESLINNYEGCHLKGNMEAVASKCEVIINTLSMDAYYANRSISSSGRAKFDALVEDISLFLKILKNELKENRAEETLDSNDRLPNIDTDKAFDMYK